MGEVNLVNDIDEVKEHLASNQLAVINVSATWCGPCRALAPHFNQLASENANVAFCKGKSIKSHKTNFRNFHNWNFSGRGRYPSAGFEGPS